MATEPLNKNEKKANEFLKLHHSRTFTKKEYQHDDNAKFVLGYHDMVKPFSLSDDDPVKEEEKLYDRLMGIVNDRKLREKKIDSHGSIQKLFGIHHSNPLTSILADAEYDIAASIDPIKCIECDNNIIKEIAVKHRITWWKSYCNLVDKFINYTKEVFPNWSTLPKEEKNKFIQTLEVVSTAPFHEVDEFHASSTKLYVHFLKNYGLNQGKKAKADMLLQMKLPNINDFKTASEVVTYTIFKNF